jgi:uncharacterized protein
MTIDSRTGSQAGLPGPLPSWARIEAAGIIIDVHLRPGARRSAIVGEHDGRLKIALQAPPTDGRANAGLLKFLADRLALPQGAVTLVAGARQRRKRVAIACAPPHCSEIIARLAPG